MRTKNLGHCIREGIDLPGALGIGVLWGYTYDIVAVQVMVLFETIST